jgi:hypothetical protein
MLGERLYLTTWLRVQDDDNAVSYAEKMCGSVEECSAWINLLVIQSRNRLDLPAVWLAVEALADELMRLKTITGAAARKIIRKAIADSAA